MYFAHMDLEKSYDRVARRALWQVVSINEVWGGGGGKLLRALQSSYDDNKMRVVGGGGREVRVV